MKTIYKYLLYVVLMANGVKNIDKLDEKNPFAHGLVFLIIAPSVAIALIIIAQLIEKLITNL